MRQFLTKEKLQETVPSIFVDHPIQEVSDRYTFVSSEKVMDNFAKLGWYPTEARTCKSIKDPNNKIYEKHLVRFAHENEVAKNGEIIPEIVMFNSHNRSTAFKLTMGLFRFVCENGMVVADNMFINITQKHINIDFNYIEKVTYEAAEEFQLIGDKIEDYKQIELTPHERNEFALTARNYHWGTNSVVEPAKLLETKRSEDEGYSLWNSFNVIQENVMKGGIVYQGRNEEGKVRQRRTRGVTNVARDLKINVVLWTMMENFRIHKRF